MLSAIATGNVDAADVFFLIAAVVFGLVAVYIAVKTTLFEQAAVAAGLCLLSIAFLLL